MLKVLEQTISNEYMTTNNNNRIPELRFPGFTGEWVVKKLGEIAEKVNSRNRDKSETRVLTNSATEGVVDQNDYFDRDIAVKENTDNYHIVEINDFVYNPRISSSAPVGPISRNKIGKGIMSPLYTVFRFKSEDINFLEHFFNTTIWHKYLKSVANYGARFDRMAISIEDFYSMPILLPTLAEQQKIAECLSSLDEEIAAEAQKADALKTHKRGLMQQLFPQEGKTTPQRRFPGFEGEWVVKKFDELFSLLSNNTCSRADLNESNGIAVNIHYGDVLIKYNEILNIQDTKIPFITESKLVSKYKDSILRDGDIIIADTAEDSTVGKCTEIQNRQQTIILSGLHTIPARPLRKFAKGFLGYIMNSESYHDQLLPLMQGAKVSSISRTAIKKTFICFPTLAEQQKIADCLSELDEMISAQQQKVEALKEHKKGLMQKLFPKMINTK